MAFYDCKIFYKKKDKYLLSVFEIIIWHQFNKKLIVNLYYMFSVAIV